MAPDLAAVRKRFGLPAWPNGQAALDLGGRELTVLPLPGHDPSHIAVYDRRTGLLLTGDTLYPGKLTVFDWDDYRASAARLAAFAEQHPVSLVLGNHSEMKNVRGVLYPIPTRFQPDEHVLPLTAAHIQEWHAACEAMAGARTGTSTTTSSSIRTEIANRDGVSVYDVNRLPTGEEAA